MENTFLWMPQPNTIVVKDGKPVIDCNPRPGTLIVTFRTTAELIFDLNGPDCFVDVGDVTQNSILYVGVIGSLSKIVNLTPSPQATIPVSKTATYYTSGTPTSSNVVKFDSGNINVSVAELPCVTSQLGLNPRLEWQVSNCMCQDTQFLPLPCETQFNVGATLTSQITVSNNSPFEIYAAGTTLGPGEYRALPDVVTTKGSTGPGYDYIYQTISI